MDVRFFAAALASMALASVLGGQTSLPVATAPASESTRPDFGDEPIPALPPLPASGPATSVPSTASAPTTATTPPPSQPAAREPEIDPTVRRQYEAGLDRLTQGDLLHARAELSEAFFSRKLDAARRKAALETLTDLADKSLLSSKALEGDPYTSTCQVGKGDTLQRIVEREKLLVHPLFLAKINGVESSKLKVGQTLKLVRGPVHAVVDKGCFTMDLYLQCEGRPKAFLTRLKVGVGKDGGTPEGAWLVGKKAARARWSPPTSAAESRPIAWGEAGYPLGREGYWIALVGADDNTRGRAGYGLHGTNEPQSIGKAASLGCVRLADEDIELAYWLLAERFSTVTVRR